MAQQLISLTNHAQLYIVVHGRAVRVSAIALGTEDANAYLVWHREQGVIAESGEIVFIAENDDRGSAVLFG